MNGQEAPTVISKLEKWWNRFREGGERAMDTKLQQPVETTPPPPMYPPSVLVPETDD